MSASIPKGHILWPQSTYIGTTSRLMCILFGYMDPSTLNPHRTLMDPVKEPLIVPLKEPYLGTWTLQNPKP